MTSTESWRLALLAAAVLHLVFQAVVTLVVYPRLAAREDWSTAHPTHTRRITPVVAIVYGALLLAVVWALAEGWREAGVVVALVGALGAFLTTALIAAPAHGRLQHGKDPAVLRRLLVVDRVRLGYAVVCAVGAAVTVAA